MTIDIYVENITIFSLSLSLSLSPSLLLESINLKGEKDVSTSAEVSGTCLNKETVTSLNPSDRSASYPFKISHKFFNTEYPIFLASTISVFFKVYDNRWFPSQFYLRTTVFYVMIARSRKKLKKHAPKWFKHLLVGLPDKNTTEKLIELITAWVLIRIWLKEWRKVSLKHKTARSS